VIVAWPFDEDEGSNHNWKKAVRLGFRKENGTCIRKQNKAMPVRIVSNQMYYKDTPFFHALSALYVFYALSPEQRATYKAHFGETTELLYALGSYGIPTNLLPISCTGAVKFGNQIVWLNFLRTRERHLQHKIEDGKNIVDCPRSYDVAFRAGTTFRNNPGNTYYRELIEKYSDDHTTGDKKKKYEITLRIITEIEKRDGRFLEWSKPKQMCILMKDRDRIRKKIAAAFKQYFRMRKVAEQSSYSQKSKEKESYLESAIDTATDTLVTSNKQQSNEPPKKS